MKTQDELDRPFRLDPAATIPDATPVCPRMVSPRQTKPVSIPAFRDSGLLGEGLGSGREPVASEIANEPLKESVYPGRRHRLRKQHAQVVTALPVAISGSKPRFFSLPYHPSAAVKLISGAELLGPCQSISVAPQREVLATLVVCSPITCSTRSPR
jgi:hypothetical protein